MKPGLKQLIVVGGAAEGMHSFDRLAQLPADRRRAPGAHGSQRSVPDGFTSGTTGDPKCALHSFNTTLYAVGCSIATWR